MKYEEPTAEEYELIAEKVRSGEYFREARAMYDISVDDFLSERYFYLAVTCVSFVVFLISLLAVNNLYPLSRAVPFPYAVNDPIEDLPRIIPLKTNYKQPASEAVLFFLASNYVRLAEQYSIDSIERNISGIRSQSSDEAFGQYRNRIDTQNPESPARLYERHSVRNVCVVSVRQAEGKLNEVEVVFDANVVGQAASEKSRFVANIAFNYSGVELDDKTGSVKPLSFTVTKYSSKQIQSGSL